MTDRVDRERLESHIEWLDGNHDRCNPFLAKDIRALLAERDALDHELSRFRQDRSYVIGFNDGWESALAEQEKKDD